MTENEKQDLNKLIAENLFGHEIKWCPTSDGFAMCYMEGKQYVDVPDYVSDIAALQKVKDAINALEYTHGFGWNISTSRFRGSGQYRATLSRETLFFEAYAPTEGEAFCLVVKKMLEAEQTKQ